jgi:N6-adenosine-specific RNA methylase IME4
MLPTLPGVVFEPTRLHLPDDLPYERWLQIVHALLSMEGGVQWWIADCWAFGEHKYGERVKAANDIGRSFQTCANYGSVGRRFDFSRRRQNLSFAHHEAVAALPPDEQEQWLDEAEAHGLMRNDLRSQLRQAKAVERTHKVEFDAKALGKFTCILADPPYQYEHMPPGGYTRAVENHYPTMSRDEICALHVPDVCARHAVLFLWSPPPLFLQAATIMVAWGFQYRTHGVWRKDKIGLGYILRQQHEDFLIGTRGEMPTPLESNRQHSVFDAPRGEHSAKPDRMYELIEAMYGGPRLEMFARKSRPGWTCWGNQIHEPPKPTPASNEISEPLKPASDDLDLDIPGFLRRAPQ